MTSLNNFEDNQISLPVQDWIRTSNGDELEKLKKFWSNELDSRDYTVDQIDGKSERDKGIFYIVRSYGYALT